MCQSPLSQGEGNSGQCRQTDRKCGSLALRALHLQLAAVLLDDAVLTLSPNPVPLPTGLVVKNGSKIRSRCSALMPQPVSVTFTAPCRRRGRRADGQLAAVGHRVAGVQREVQQDLLELVHVAVDFRQILLQVFSRSLICSNFF